MTQFSVMEDCDERIKKTLYLGQCDITRPSLPLTKLAVKLSRSVTSRQLGHIDLDQAASIERNANTSPCQMVLGLMYVKRIKKYGSHDYLQNVTSSDLFLLSMMMASKYLYDQGTDDEIFNDEWAEITGQETEDVNAAETLFLKNIDWNLYVKPSDFEHFLKDIERGIALDEGVDRGWFSYTDLDLLSDRESANILYAHVVDSAKLILACSIAYIAGVVTIALAICLPQTIHPKLASLLEPHPLPSVESNVMFRSSIIRESGDILCDVGNEENEFSVGFDNLKEMVDGRFVRNDQILENVHDIKNGLGNRCHFGFPTPENEGTFGSGNLTDGTSAFDHVNCKGVSANENGDIWCDWDDLTNENSWLDHVMSDDRFLTNPNDEPGHVITDSSNRKPGLIFRAFEHSLIALVFGFDSEIPLGSGDDIGNFSRKSGKFCERCVDQISKIGRSSNGVKAGCSSSKGTKISTKCALMNKMCARKMVESKELDKRENLAGIRKNFDVSEKIVNCGVKVGSVGKIPSIGAGNIENERGFCALMENRGICGENSRDENWYDATLDYGGWNVTQEISDVHTGFFTMPRIGLKT